MSSLQHSTQVGIRFSDADPAGILFFGRLFELSHAALESFVVASGIGWQDWYASPTWAVPIVCAKADYKLPLKTGATVVVDVLVTKVGRSSCSFEFVFKCEEIVHAVATTTHVFVSKDGFSSLPIPESIRAILQQYLVSPIDS
jgi:acyl-CoA thioesterase FadM